MTAPTIRIALDQRAASSHRISCLGLKRTISPVASAIAADLRQITTEIWACLTPREEHIVRMRFGIGMNADHTLEEVGKRFSVTRERIRQSRGQRAAETHPSDPRPPPAQLSRRLKCRQ